MQRYFIDSNVPESQKISIGIPHYHHIINVMRHVSGGQLIFVFNAGETYIVTIEEVEKETISCHLTERLEKTVELPIDVTLACGLPKGDKLDLIVQKTTELGIFSIQPFEAERSIVKWDEKKETKKRQRLQKIAQEAAEQSHRVHVPEILPLLTSKKLLLELAQYTHVFIADEEEAKINEQKVFKKLLNTMKINDKLLIITGPEGGLSRNEVTSYIEKGAISGSLGPRILRTETAPLYAMAAISYEFEL